MKTRHFVHARSLTSYRGLSFCFYRLKNTHCVSSLAPKRGGILSYIFPLSIVSQGEKAIASFESVISYSTLSIQYKFCITVTIKDSKKGNTNKNFFYTSCLIRYPRRMEGKKERKIQRDGMNHSGDIYHFIFSHWSTVSVTWIT